MRTTAAAFSALERLDPLQGLPQACDGNIDDRIARIVTTPRASTHFRAEMRPRARTGVALAGAAASAVLAIAATLLWISPSAGAPSDQAVGSHAAIAATTTVQP